jgi:hypothetical protein
MMTLGANDDTGLLLVVAVGRKRHPVGFDRCGVGAHGHFLKGLSGNGITLIIINKTSIKKELCNAQG